MEFFPSLDSSSFLMDQVEIQKLIEKAYQDDRRDAEADAQQAAESAEDEPSGEVADPPPELVHRWEVEGQHHTYETPLSTYIATQAARWGAAQRQAVPVAVAKDELAAVISELEPSRDVLCSPLSSSEDFADELLQNPDILIIHRDSTRAADLLERHLASVLVPDCERNWDSLLSPSGGYEMADDAALRDGSQLVNGEWWAPVFGCDSLEAVLDRIRERLQRLAGPVPVAVADRMPQPEDCDAEGRVWGFHPYNFEDDDIWNSWSLVPARLIQSTLIWVGWAYWLPAHALPTPSVEVK